MISIENYLIRPLGISDLHKYFDLVTRNRERLEDFFTGTVSRTQNIESTKDFLIEISERRAEEKYFPFIVIEETSGNFVAFFDLKNIDWSIPKTELGFYTDGNYAGKGITSKVLPVFLEHCFTNYKFRKIFLRTHESNKAAQALAAKCGFTLEGRIRHDYKTTAGELVDLMYFGLLSEQ